MNSLILGEGYPGVLLGAIVVFTLSSLLSRQALLDWGWRIPFLLSIPLSMTIFRIRHKLIINCKLKPTFLKSIKFNFSLINLMLIAFLIVAVTQVTFYLIYVWLPLYLIYFIHIQESIARLSNVISLLISVGFIIFWGMMANCITCKNIFIFNMLALACLIIPLFTLLNTGIFTLIIISQIVLAFFSSGMNATIVKILADMFPSSIRVLAVSITFTFGASFFGGTAPMLATFLLHKYHYYWLPPVYIISLVILVFFISFKIDFLRKSLLRKVSFFRYSLLK